jgi:recombinational DNA repair protein (RecF pathway)
MSLNVTPAPTNWCAQAQSSIINHQSSIETTDGIVLRKTAYSETSLIIAVLTPSQGQMSFMLKGARRSGKRAFVEVDLFRHVSISYRPSSRSELHTARTAECLTAFDVVATEPAHFRLMSCLARLILDHSHAGAPIPQVYAGLLGTLQRLQRDRDAPSVPLLLANTLLLLADEGLLPDYSADPETEAKLRGLMQLPLSPEAPIPPYADHDWSALKEWLEGLALEVDVVLPKGWGRV